MIGYACMSQKQHVVEHIKDYVRSRNLLVHMNILTAESNTTLYSQVVFSDGAIRITWLHIHM